MLSVICTACDGSGRACWPQQQVCWPVLFSPFQHLVRFLLPDPTLPASLLSHPLLPTGPGQGRTAQSARGRPSQVCVQAGRDQDQGSRRRSAAGGMSSASSQGTGVLAGVLAGPSSDTSDIWGQPLKCQIVSCC